MARRLITFVGVLVGLILAALVAGAAYSALKAPLGTVAPEDLNLIDSGRRSSIPFAGIAGCKSFARQEFSGGKTFGPGDICFRVADSTPPFILHWTPDIGAFCCERDITIYPT